MTDRDSSMDGKDDEATPESKPRLEADETGEGRVRGWGSLVPGSRRAKSLLSVVLVLVLGAGVGSLIWLRSTSLPEDAAFAYGDRVVTVDELDARVQVLRALYGVEPPSNPARREAFRGDVAKSMALSMILDRSAAEHHIVIADRQARDVLDRFIAERYGGSRYRFVQALGNVGTAEHEVIEEIKRQIAVGELMDKVVGQVRISDDQLRSAFEKRSEEMGLPERRVLRNIVVASEQAARAVFEQLRNGVPFERVAVQRSLDASTKRTGGLLGALSREQLEHSVGRAAFAVQAGEFYGPVRSRHGWNIGRVERILPPAPPQFDQVRKQLENTLKAEESLRRWRSWLSEQLRRAEIEYSDNYRPTHPAAPPGAGASQRTSPGPQPPASPR